MLKHLLQPLAPGALILLAALIVLEPAQAQTVTLGAGSYTETLPAGAQAPSTQIFNTVSGPIPTHRFWTAKNWYATDLINNCITFGATACNTGGAYTIQPQPLGMETTPAGLLLGFDATIINGGTFYQQPFEGDLTIGVTELNAASVPVSAYGDWSVTFNFGPLSTTVGRGMPFVYVTTTGGNPQITFAGQPTVFANQGNILGVSIANNNYGLFCPSGGTWSGIGSTVLTCNQPSGHNYFSLALLPSQSALSAYAPFAFSFPSNTAVAWNYDPATSAVTTTYTVTTTAMEGSQTGFLQALYPHQYSALGGGSTVNTSFTYPSARGTLEVINAASFTTVNIYHGILPFLPPTGNSSTSTLTSLLNTVANEGNHFAFTGADTYDVGKDLARVAQLLPIASIAGDQAALSSLQGSLQSELQLWFNGAANSQTTNVFYYDPNWGTVIGYPAAFGSDIALNDHHFHYGYWIHASALLGLVNPGWIQPASWGGMVGLLAQDIATPVRNDPRFPFLRHFDVYAGHSWASGQAPFGDGGNQEASSEAINAETGLILFAIETGDTALRDAAIWMYTQETNAAFDYWFNDGPVPSFPPGFTRVEIANVFDGKSDTGTFFSGQIEMEHGIEFLPFTGGSLYLGRDPAYVEKNIAEISSIDANVFASGSTNWPDLIEEFQAFADPSTALANFQNTSFVFDGESKAHEYYWLTQLQELGNVDEAVTADTPLYRVFKNPGSGAVTHAAFNAGTSSITAHFSDGVALTVPAGSMASEFGTVTLGSGSAAAAPAPPPSSTPSPSPPPPAPAPTSSATSGTVAIHAGGGAVGGFVADTDFSGGNTASSTAAIDESLIPSPAPPQALYQTNRWGPATYTIPGLTAGASTTVTLHFAETFWSAAGKRQFNVIINGTQVLTNFDIFANAGAMNKAIEENFAATVNSSGQVVIQFADGAVDNPMVSGIVVTTTGAPASGSQAASGTGSGAAPAAPPPTTVSASSGKLAIHAGGGAVGSFVADADFSGGNVATSPAAIDESLIPSPAPPQALYQANRWGPVTYTLPGFTPGAAATVTLHFAETFWSASGKRQFNIAINDKQVLTNFDIFANAGAMNKAIEENFSATVNNNGQVVIQLTDGAVDNPMVSGIVVTTN
jgi:endoglucanase Acf2